MSASLLEITGLAVDLGGRPALREVALTLARGESVGLIGPNGAGKSTLLKAIMGLVAAQGVLRFPHLPGLEIAICPGGSSDCAKHMRRLLSNRGQNGRNTARSD